jgi:hypothetical protein
MARHDSWLATTEIMRQTRDDRVSSGVPDLVPKRFRLTV